MLSLLFCSSLLIAGEPVGIAWFNGNESALRQAAREKQKPYVLVYYTEWCEPCREMDAKVWNQDAIVRLVNRQFLALKVTRADQTRSLEAVTPGFDLMFYPTVVVYAPDGRELYRSAGFVETELLADKLNEIGEGYAPAPAGSPSASLPARPEKPVASGEGLFQFDLKAMPSQGYAIQVGVYADYRNVLKDAFLLQYQLGSPVLVHINQLQGRTVFKILTGPFVDVAEASQFNQIFQAKTGRSGLVVNLQHYK